MTGIVRRPLRGRSRSLRPTCWQPRLVLAGAGVVTFLVAGAVPVGALPAGALLSHRSAAGIHAGVALRDRAVAARNLSVGPLAARNLAFRNLAVGNLAVGDLLPGAWRSPVGLSAGKHVFQDIGVGLGGATTTTGVKVTVDVDANRSPTDPATRGISVYVSTRTGAESHSWSFPTTANAFKINAGGSGTIRTGTAAEPYGTLTMSFAPTGSAQKILACNASNYTLERPEHLTGRFSFDTRSTGPHRWGRIGTAAKPIAFKVTAFLTTTYEKGNCTRPSSPGFCSSSLVWFASNSTTDFFGSVGSGQPASIEAFRSVALPKHAARTDYVASLAPAPRLTTAGRSALLRVRTSGHIATGSATLRSKAPATPQTSRCTTGTKKGTEKETVWQASVTSGAAPLRIHEQIFGAFRLSNKVTATIDRTTT